MNLSRLAFHFTLSLLAAGAVLAEAPQLPDVGSTYETVKVAEGIWTFVAPEPKSALASGNCTAIIGDDSVLVVDSGMVPSLTRRMIADIKGKSGGKPVRYLVNTHWHWDHNFGNFVYRDQYPDITIISTPFTRQSIAEYDSMMLAGYVKGGTALVEALKQQAASGKKRDGTTMNAEEKKGQADLLHDAAMIMPEVQAGRVELPNQTFTDSLTIYLGKREVDIRYLGRGNTAGDAVVYVPDAKVLMTGDLLVAPIPFATGSYISEWIEVMKKLGAFDTTAIVPGHGPVERDRTHLEIITALLQSVLTQMQQFVKQGLTLEEARAKLDIGAYREQLTRGIASRQKNFHDYFEKPIVDTLYKQLNGQPITESPFG